MIFLHTRSAPASVLLGVMYYLTQLATLVIFLSVINGIKLMFVRIISAMSLSLLGAYLATCELSITFNSISNKIMLTERFFYLELLPFSTLIICCWVSAYGINRLGMYLCTHRPSVITAL
jgi:hypothetical protein